MTHLLPFLTAWPEPWDTARSRAFIRFRGRSRQHDPSEDEDANQIGGPAEVAA